MLPGKICLLIDAENISPYYLPDIISDIKKHGTICILRAYGDWTNPILSSWQKLLSQNGIQPIQQFRLVSGKNASDFAMLIDAMDILYQTDIHTFGLVSSDSDFTSLAIRLKEDGKQVLGYGEIKTSSAFTSACSSFFYLGKEIGSKEKSILMSELIEAIRASLQKDGWACLAMVGLYLKNNGFDLNSYGYKKLSDLIAAQYFIEIKYLTVGADLVCKQMYVKLKNL